MPDTSLSDLATSILGSVTAAFATAGVTLPDRQYTHHGAVAIDCEQLVVALSRGPYLGQPQAEQGTRYRAFAPLSADFTVWLVRCVPTQDGQAVPTVSDLSASAETLMTDAKTAYAGLLAAYDAKTFSDHCSDLFIGPGIPYGPEGGFGGTQFDVKVQLG